MIAAILALLLAIVTSCVSFIEIRCAWHVRCVDDGSGALVCFAKREECNERSGADE